MSRELLDVDKTGFLFFRNSSRTQIVTFRLGQKESDVSQ